MTTPSSETPNPENAQTPPQNAPETQQTSPQTPPQTPPPAQSTGGNQGPSFAEVMNGLNALPEKIVHSLREAMQPQTPPQTQQTSETKKAETPPAQTQQTGQTAQAPGRKSFAEWWMGR